MQFLYKFIKCLAILLSYITLGANSAIPFVRLADRIRLESGPESRIQPANPHLDLEPSPFLTGVTATCDSSKQGRECDQTCFDDFDIRLDSQALRGRLTITGSQLAMGGKTLATARRSSALRRRIPKASVPNIGDTDTCRTDNGERPTIAGRPGVSGHNKYERYMYYVSLWCESGRPCLVYGGSASASHNVAQAANAFQSGSSWTSGTIPATSLASGDVWIAYAYPSRLIAGSLSFTSAEVAEFVFEGSDNGENWSELSLKPESANGLKVDDGGQPRAFARYRLRITGTEWSREGRPSGSLTVKDFQICLLDDFATQNDNNYVTSPPFIPFGRAFASSRWGRNWAEQYAFYGQHVVWSSEYLYATNGWLNSPQHIGFTFPVARTVRKIGFMGTYQRKYMNDHPKTFSFQGSANGHEWTDLLSTTIEDFPSTNHEVELEIPEANIRPYEHFRLYVNKTGWSNKGLSGGYLQLRAYKMC